MPVLCFTPYRFIKITFKCRQNAIVILGLCDKFTKYIGALNMWLSKNNKKRKERKKKKKERKKKKTRSFYWVTPFKIHTPPVEDFGKVYHRGV